MTAAGQSITFFYPSYILGGAELLFIRLAKHIAESTQTPVFVIDYPDGFLAQSLAGSNVQLLAIDGYSKPTPPERTCLVAPVSTLFAVQAQLQLRPDTHLLFWFLHPYNAIHILPGFGRLGISSRKSVAIALYTIWRRNAAVLRRALQIAHKGGGLIYMDRDCLDVNQELLKLNVAQPLFIPIPAPAPSKIRRECLEDLHPPAVLRACWVGRLVDFKIHALLYIIAAADAFCRQSGRQMEFIVVGDGDKRQILLDALPDNPLLQVTLAGEIPADRLDEFLVEKADILFAVGTASLEGAKCRIPVVQVDAGYTPLRNYLFRWIFESEPYSIGNLLSRGESARNSRHTFADVIAQLEAAPMEIAQRCFERYEKQHSLQASSDLLLHAARNCTLLARDIEKAGAFSSSALTRLYRRLKHHKKILKKK